MRREGLDLRRLLSSGALEGLQLEPDDRASEKKGGGFEGAQATRAFLEGLAKAEGGLSQGGASLACVFGGFSQTLQSGKTSLREVGGAVYNQHIA